MFRTFIDNVCYVHGIYNEKYVPLKWAYEIEDYNHDFLVIGYDNDNIYSAGFVADGRFKQYKIPNQKFIEAVNNTGSSRVSINFFSYNDGVIPKPNIGRMLSDLDKYILTANYLDSPTPNATSYGISALMRVKDFFADEVLNNKKLYVDRRYSRVLYEHEWVLTQVIDVFLDSKEKTEFINRAKNNLDRAKLVHMLGLKLELTGTNNLIHRIANLIDQVVEDEMQYIHHS